MCTSRAMVSGSRGTTAGIRVTPGEPNLRLEQPRKALPMIAVKQYPMRHAC